VANFLDLERLRWMLAGAGRINERVACADYIIKSYFYTV
jgi:hypothetical protein